MLFVLPASDGAEKLMKTAHGMSLRVAKLQLVVLAAGTHS